MYQVISTLKSLEFVRCCVSANGMTNSACRPIGTVPKCCHFEERTGASCNRFGSNSADTEIDDSHRTCNQQITIKNFLALPLLCQTNDGEIRMASRLTIRMVPRGSKDKCFTMR